MSILRQDFDIFWGYVDGVNICQWQGALTLISWTTIEESDANEQAVPRHT